jgi:His-Xaa-Ser system radical SAM maturase HxsB
VERSLTLSLPELAEDQLGFFRWGRIGDKVVVTTDAADWTLLSEADFADLLAGRITSGHARFQELQGKGLLRDGLDLDALAAKVAQRNRHVRRGPHLHVVTLTLRRTAGDAAGGRPVIDMSSETAEQIVDLALQGPSPSMTFELQGQGGEPLLNFDVLRHFVEVAQTKNKRTTGKTLGFRLLSNFTGMTESAADWLIANDVLVSTSFDGPAALHDWTRGWKGGSPHADVVRWIEYFNRRYAELGRDARLWHVDAQLTTTRRTLEAGKQVVDEYVTRGFRTIHLRPLERARFDDATWATIGYSPQEYLDFYRRTLDYILDLNRRGVELMEGMASIILMKILTTDDPGIVDIQSPCGAGTGQIAYDVDGRVFPCDEARQVDVLGDPIFELGTVGTLQLADVVQHPTVRAIAAASLLDAQPMCADCWNKPFCGFSPVRNFITQGDLFGQRPRCLQCREHLTVSSRLFELLASESDAQTAEILKRWTIRRSPFAIDGRSLKDAP